MERTRILRAVEVMATCLAGGTDQLSALQAAGFSAQDARVIADTLPEAFALPAMEELGVVVDEWASVKNSDGKWVRVSLAKCSFFRGALELAREHRASGTLPQSTYRAIAERSAQVTAVSKALNAGSNVKGGNLSVSLISAFAEDFGVRQ